MLTKKLSRAVVTTAALVTMGLSANAAAVSGKVNRIYVNSTGVVHLRIAQDTCSGYWTFRLTDPAGEAWYTLLLSSYHAGTSVHLSTPPCIQNKSQQITSVFQDF